MIPEVCSFAVQVWYSAGADAAYMRVTSIDDPTRLQLAEGAYLVRISTDEAHATTRCLIRHVSSGREAHLQGGAGLHALIRNCLLRAPAPSTHAESPLELAEDHR